MENTILDTYERFFSRAYEMVYMKNYNNFNYTYIMENVLVTCLKFYS